jgi:hypothetical protein
MMIKASPFATSMPQVRQAGAQNCGKTKNLNLRVRACQLTKLIERVIRLPSLT